ncbi:MAG: methyltransferase domain-containing protein, partial [Nocardioidaceae bacterium]
MRVDVFQDLLSDVGQRLLAEAAQEYDGTGALALGTRLRRRYDPDLVAAALAQLDLRRRAVPKFGTEDAARMYFTSEALEQATSSSVAAHRAGRMRGAGRRLADLGCGIGSDLVAAARAGLTVTGVERDPLRAEVARANLAALGLPGTVVEQRAEQVDLAAFEVVFVDPARRDARGRLFDPAAYSPPWAFVQQVLGTRTACVKVGPAIPHRQVPAGVEAEWVSEHREVKEAALWSGRLATARRRASLLPAGLTLIETGAEAAVAPVGAFLYEPDPAIIRAGLVAELADELEAGLVDPRIAYLTADRRVRTPYARCFRVVERLP